jgi:hypothetical protein
MDDVARRYEPDVTSIFLYVREAHPGEKHGHHETLADKLASARTLIERFGVARRVLVDDLEGTAHAAYGLLPNMTYVLRRRGRIYYRASWTDARTVDAAVGELRQETTLRREGKLPLPYWMEWEPARPRDRAAFMQGLLDVGGAQAVQEYLDEAGQAFGEAYVAPLRRWWAPRSSE